MQPSQEQVAEMIVAMNQQCKFFEEQAKYNPKDDQAYAAWGSMLMHLSMVSEDQDVKKRYLKQSIEKLEKAITLKEDSKTHEGELALFSLGNALYFNFFLEKDDGIAETFLKQAKTKFEAAKKKDKDNPLYSSMLEQLAGAHEQRRATHEHLRRLEGKSESEKQKEIRLLQVQMLESVVENYKSQVAREPGNIGAKCELAKSMFELAMLHAAAEATEIVKQALEVLEKGGSNPEPQQLWIQAVLYQALSFSHPATSATNQKKAKDLFDKVLELERDADRRSALKKEREILEKTMITWRDGWPAVEQSAPAKRERATREKAAAAPPSGPKGASAPSAGQSGDSSNGQGLVVVFGCILAAGLVALYLSRRKA